jgi:hypothetical protein
MPMDIEMLSRGLMLAAKAWIKTSGVSYGG